MANRKLTAPQLALLREIAGEPQQVSMRYPPTQRLVVLELIKVRETRYGGYHAEVTEAGKAELSRREANR